MIRHALTMCRYRWLDSRRLAGEANWAWFVVVLAFVALGIGIALGLFRFFSLAFPYLLSEPYSGPVIIKYLIELSLATVLFLGVVSFVVSSMSFLFRDRSMALLFSLPIEPTVIYWQRFIILSALSAWPVLLVAVPALTALGVAQSASAIYYLSIIPVLLLFILLISAFGGVLSFFVAMFLRRMPTLLIYLVETVLFLLAAVIVTRQVVNAEVFTLLGAITPQGAAAAELRLQDIFSSLPSHPFAAATLSVFPGQLGGTSGLTWVLAIILASWLLLFWLARRSYLRLWQDFGEGNFLARGEDVLDVRPRSFNQFPKIMRWGHGYLLEKDLISLLRNPGEVSRAIFLLVLLMLYVFAVRAVSSMDIFANPEMFPLIISVVFAALGYITLTLAIRFAFPALSIEGRGAWVILASPLHMHEILSWKFFFWGSLSLLLMEAVTVLIAILFSLPLVLTLFLLFATSCSVVTLTAITLCQGTIRPNFRQTNPDMLSTSPSGLLATGFGMLYIWITARYVQTFVASLTNRGAVDLVAAIGILVVSLTITVGYFFFAYRAIERLQLSR
ncbi:MAG: hypothetical protein V1738_00660 [Patescibacteria group bacterium]